MARSNRPTVWIEKYRNSKGWNYRVRQEMNGERGPSVNCGPRKEYAEQVRARLQDDLWAGRLGLEKRSGSRSLGEFAKEYLDYCVSHKAKNTVQHFDRPAVLDMVEDLGAEKALISIRVDDLEKHKMSLLKRLSPNTVRMRLRSVKAAFGYAKRLGYITNVPSSGLALPKAEDVGRVLTPAEIQKLVSDVSPILARGLIFALNTGMRRGEILGLDWKSVHRSHGHLEAHLEGKTTKTRRSRTVTLNAAAEAVMGPPRPHGKVFEGLTVDVIELNLRLSAQRLKLGRIRFHDFRHTWATEYMRKTGDLFGLMQQGGWSSTTAVSKYQHLTKARSEAMMGLDFGIKIPTFPHFEVLDKSGESKKVKEK